MSKIFTIAYLPKAESRENILNSILGEEENNFKENFEWILTKTSVRISKKYPSLGFIKQDLEQLNIVIH